MGNFYKEMYRKYKNADKTTQEKGLNYWLQKNLENITGKNEDCFINSAKMVTIILLATQENK